MTNLSAGVKRSWEGVDSATKRSKEDNKDWKDVHLRSPEIGRQPSSSKAHGSRNGIGYDRRYDDRDRDRNRERHRDRRRSRDKDRPRSRERRDSPRTPSIHKKPDEETEEGEIPSTPPRGISQTSDKSASATPPAPAPEPQPEVELPTNESVDPEVARRARLEKWKAIRERTGATIGIPSSGYNSAVLPPPTPSNVSDRVPASSIDTPVPPSATATEAMSFTPSDNDFALAKGEEERHSRSQTSETMAQVSAGDYDPSMDRREDEKRRVYADEVKLEEEIEVEEEEVDEDDLDDMFAVVSNPKPKSKKVVKKTKPSVPAVIASATLDTASDPEGYYTVILAEQLDGGRYQVFSSLGKGMFANVVRARVLQPESGEAPGREVAIKIIRCQETMHRSGQKEAQILMKLQQADPDDKKHLVRLERTFEHRGHLCLVFENLSMNLREVVKRFGKDVGLNLKAVRAYAHQLFIALSHLKKVGVIHADIKPDNVLVNEAKNVLKLCDLGSASDACEGEITPYLVSRFYRAPEIILGYPYDAALDVWSAACTLYELYTGKILFPGRSNNQMLLIMMELKGRFNSKMIKKAKFGEVYFDEVGAFSSFERDKVTGNDVIKKIHISKPTRELRARLMPPASVKMKDDESKLLMSFIDFLDKCLALDPAKRLSAREALAHPFIRG